ncbi:MAG: gamma-glutamylcyclotransferase [Planctomycetota bacterium]
MSELWYFAYGSNMNPERMELRRAFFSRRIHGVLDGWSLAFDTVRSDGSAAANIHPSPGCRVEGALYLVPPSSLDALDRFEGVPHHYVRTEVIVRTASEGLVPAIAYVATEASLREGIFPTKEYLSHLLRGEDLLSPEYFNTLKAQRTAD